MFGSIGTLGANGAEVSLDRVLVGSASDDGHVQIATVVNAISAENPELASRPAQLAEAVLRAAGNIGLRVSVHRHA